MANWIEIPGTRWESADWWAIPVNRKARLRIACPKAQARSIALGFANQPYPDDPILKCRGFEMERTPQEYPGLSTMTLLFSNAVGYQATSTFGIRGVFSFRSSELPIFRLTDLDGGLLGDGGVDGTFWEIVQGESKFSISAGQFSITQSRVGWFSRRDHVLATAFHDTVNNKAFAGFPAGTLLFKGADADYNSGGLQAIEDLGRNRVTFNWKYCSVGWNSLTRVQQFRWAPSEETVENADLGGAAEGGSFKAVLKRKAIGETEGRRMYEEVSHSTMLNKMRSTLTIY